MKLTRRMIALLCGLCMLWGAALSEQTTTIAATLEVVDKGIDLTGGSVHYPQVNGMTDAAMQEAVNQQILDSASIPDRLNRLAVLGSSGDTLTVSWQGGMAGEVFSCAVSALGAVEDSRTTQIWSAVNVDLRTGGEITFDDLFLDSTAAVTLLEDYLWDQVAPEMSAHLQNSDLTPVPEVFSLSATGITLYYPIRQLSTLSDRAGTVTVLWTDLKDQLKTGEDTVLRRIGAEKMMTLDESSRESIGALIAQGMLPGIPARLGDGLPELIDRYHLAADADLYQDGRMVMLEDGAFRGVFVLTDALTEEWANSTVQGIRADQLCLYGLVIGQTQQSDWRGSLGEPDATVAVDADKADAYRIEVGSSDYYRFGGYRLRLHADESGVLRNVLITQ